MKKWEAFLGKIMVVPFFKRLRSEFIVELMSTKLYKWLLKKVIPYIRFTTYYTSLRGHKYHVGYSKLKPGDILLTNDKKKLTSLLIPGDWSHAGLCVSKDGMWEVSEMTHNDYTKSCFFDLCKEADRVMILRAKDWSEKYTKKVIEKCKELKNAKYDTQFDLGIEALYCSELVYQSDYKRSLQFDLDDFIGLKRKYLSPDGIYHCRDLLIVWDSNDSVLTL